MALSSPLFPAAKTSHAPRWIARFARPRYSLRAPRHAARPGIYRGRRADAGRRHRRQHDGRDGHERRPVHAAMARTPRSSGGQSGSTACRRSLSASCPAAFRSRRTRTSGFRSFRRPNSTSVTREASGSHSAAWQTTRPPRAPAPSSRRSDDGSRSPTRGRTTAGYRSRARSRNSSSAVTRR